MKKINLSKRITGLILSITLAIALVLSSFLPILASNQATHTVTFNNLVTIELSVSSGTYGFGDISPAAPAQSADDVITVTINANTSWKVKVKGTDFSNGVDTIPVGRLSWREDNASGTWYVMTTTDSVENVKTGVQPGGSAGMEFKIQLTFSDAAGNGYSSTITYTGTAL